MTPPLRQRRASGQREPIANRVPTASGRLESVRVSCPSHGASKGVIDKHIKYIYTRSDVLYHMYMHMCGHGCRRRRATHSKRENKQSDSPQPWPKHSRDTVHTALHKTSTQTSTKSRRRRVATSSPIDPYERTATGAQRSVGRGSHALPAAQALPNPPTSHPAELPPLPTPLLHAGQAKARRAGQGCARITSTDR